MQSLSTHLTFIHLPSLSFSTMRQGKGDPVIAAAAVAVLLLFVSSPAVRPVDGAKGHQEELTTQLINGFTATHAAGSTATFEPLLYAPSAVFALGFLRVVVGPPPASASASLDLAVVHLPSSFPVWRATPANLGDWSRAATLTFDTTLVLTAHDGAVLWRTLNAAGDVATLLNSSNLVVQRYDDASPVPAWQSFDHPSDTLVVGQNFTAASPPLVSANRRFALRLGKTYMALQMEFAGGGGTATAPVYWKHTALEAQPESATAPPIYGSLDGRGFFGLYIAGGGGGQRVDVLSFDTFVLNLAGVFRRLTLDDDGNLRAYYWSTDAGAKAPAWTSDFKAIAEPCELPTSCGAYGLCVPGAAQCQCLDGSNGTASTTTTSSSSSPPCHAEETGDLCNGGGGGPSADFDVVRRTRVSVAYKENLPAVGTNTTAGACEAACAANCTCWGAVFNGGSGYCYLIDFPVETMVYQADDRMLGYFKVRKPAAAATASRRGMSPGVTAATVVLSLVLVALAAAGAWWGYRMWERRKRKRAAGMEQELVPGQYKDLKSMASPNSSFKA